MHDIIKFKWMEIRTSEPAAFNIKKTKTVVMNLQMCALNIY